TADPRTSARTAGDKSRGWYTAGGGMGRGGAPRSRLGGRDPEGHPRGGAPLGAPRPVRIPEKRGASPAAAAGGGPMRAPLALAAGAAFAALALAVPARATLFETEPRTFPVTTHHRVRIEFPVGSLKVMPTDDSRVRFELRVRCDRSDER